jgi:DNA-binding CsgD family transcriptional regulator
MNMLVLTNRIPPRGPSNGVPERVSVAEQGAEPADLGLVLMDMSFKAIALDRGAATILGDLQGSGVQHAPSFSIPSEVQKAIRDSRLGDLPDVKVRLHLGSRDYKCHAFLVKSQSDSLPHEIVVLHLERDSSPADRVTELSAEYQLTTREQEALRGIALGLTSKELADRMEISPGTVKSFLRMIMIKLGVRTRGAILAKLIEYKGVK